MTLKGLSRVLRACTKYLILTNWFHDTWVSVSRICENTLTDIEVSDLDNEIASAGLDCLFSMLKYVSLLSDITAKTFVNSIVMNDLVDLTVSDVVSSSQAGGLSSTDTARQVIWQLCVCNC